jgi:hypothetical protein
MENGATPEESSAVHRRSTETHVNSSGRFA